MTFIDSMMVKIALIGLLGIGAQWIAWRTGKPAIALMMLAGLIAGPVTGIVVPERDFGALLEPIVKLAVAVILFDGGLSLNFRELRHNVGAILGLVVVGVPVGWALGTAAAYYGAGLPLATSALFGGIMVVTGPTVIGPLLRNLNIGRRPAQILKWEAIVNDPIGALLAVFIYAYIAYEGESVAFSDIALEVGGAALIAALIGVVLALVVSALFNRGYVPEYLKAPVLLVTVIAGFVGADLILHESGLVTVTVMGVVMANRRVYAFESLRRFKEDLGVLLVSGVFILLPATLDLETMRAFEARFLAFLLLLLFVVRPVTVMLSLLFSRVPWRERVFIAWIAPRGVVAVAVSGLFAIRLVELGRPAAEALIPLSFGVVIATIIAHGFTAPWLARRLGIDRGPGHGVLLVGANAWTIDLARFLGGLGLKVTLAGESRIGLGAAARHGLDTYDGDILDEVTSDRLDLADYQQLIAATDNGAYNALVCTDLAPEIGYHSVSQVPTGREASPLAHRGRLVPGRLIALDELLDLREAGWQFRATPAGEAGRSEGPTAAIPVAVLKPDSRLLLVPAEGRAPQPEPDDRLIVFAPPES